MKNIFFFLLLLSGTFLTYGQKDLKTISGTVTDGQEALPDVVISNLSTDAIYFTDSQGKYSFEASKGDVLKYSYNGMRDFEIRLEDVTRTLNVELSPETNNLDEVVVKGTKRLQEDLKREYVENKNVVRTAFGYIDSKRSSYNIRIVNLEDSNYNYVCITELLRARFPELQVFGNCGSSEVDIFLRGRSSINNPQSVLFDIDGQLFSEVPIQYPMVGVKRVALFKDLASRAKYGGLGAGGIIVINTFNTVPKVGPSVATKKMNKKFQDARMVSSSSSVNADPVYLGSLKDAPSLEGAKKIFGDYESRYSSSPYFYLDSYGFFYDRGERDFADGIIANSYQRLFESNANMLKALAYIYQEQERFEEANTVFKQVFVLRPNYAQSYLDIARSFRELGKPKFSAMMFARYGHLLRENFMDRDSIGFDPILDREFENLVALNKGEIAYGKDISSMPKLKNTSGVTRVVFEWNDSEAEFDLEFFKGDEQYYIWKHTYADSPDEILREKNHGYSVAEYLIDSSSQYTPWQINIEYLGNKSLTPTYLKVTTYNNYGSRSQSEEVKVIKLTTKNIKQEILTI